MKKKTKKMLKRVIPLVLIFLVALFFSLPKIFNTKEIIPFESKDIRLIQNQKHPTNYDNPSCEYDDCSRGYCLNSKELPSEIRDFKICFCCVKFDFNEDKKDGPKTWEVKEYKLKINYKENGKEIEKPFFIPDPTTEIPIPSTKKHFISMVTDYSQPYYFKENYPEELKFKLHRIRIDYIELFEFITSQS